MGNTNVGRRRSVGHCHQEATATRVEQFELVESTHVATVLDVDENHGTRNQSAFARHDGDLTAGADSTSKSYVRPVRRGAERECVPAPGASPVCVAMCCSLRLRWRCARRGVWCYEWPGCRNAQRESSVNNFQWKALPPSDHFAASRAGLSVAPRTAAGPGVGRA